MSDHSDAGAAVRIRRPFNRRRVGLVLSATGAGLVTAVLAALAVDSYQDMNDRAT